MTVWRGIPRAWGLGFTVQGSMFRVQGKMRDVEEWHVKEQLMEREVGGLQKDLREASGHVEQIEAAMRADREEHRRASSAHTSHIDELTSQLVREAEAAERAQKDAHAASLASLHASGQAESLRHKAEHI